MCVLGGGGGAPTPATKNCSKALTPAPDCRCRNAPGGPSGWPDANGTFVYRDTNSGVAYAVMETPYSIAYVGQDEAVESGLDTFSIQEVSCCALCLPGLAS